MSAAALACAERFLLPPSLAEKCLEAIRENGRRGDELFIALTAVVEEQQGVVRFRRALIPRQTAHTTPDGLLVTIDGEAIFALNRDCYEHGEMLAGQLHGHPRRAYHSGADDQLALVRLPGGLSIVVPNFAVGPTDPKSWSVHRLGRDSVWAPAGPDTNLELT